MQDVDTGLRRPHQCRGTRRSHRTGAGATCYLRLASAASMSFLPWGVVHRRAPFFKITMMRSLSPSRRSLVLSAKRHLSAHRHSSMSSSPGLSLAATPTMRATYPSHLAWTLALDLAATSRAATRTAPRSFASRSLIPISLGRASAAPRRPRVVIALDRTLKLAVSQAASPASRLVRSTREYGGEQRSVLMAKSWSADKARFRCCASRSHSKLRSKTVATS